MGLDKEELSNIMCNIDFMDEFYLPLSELLLQRKLTDKKDQQKAAIEVELILWEQGRNQMLQTEIKFKTRTTG